MQLLLNILSLSIILLLSILCLILFLRNNESKSLKSFRHFLIYAVLWLLSNYALKVFDNHLIVLFSLKTTFATSALMLYSLFLFSEKFPDEIQFKNKMLGWTALFATGLIMALSYTNFLVSGYSVENYLVLAEYGIIYYLYLAYVLLMFGMILHLFWNQYRISSPLKKQQSKFLFIGVILSMIFISSIDLVMPLLSRSNTSANFGPYGIIFMVIFAFIALTKHHLFETKVIISEFWATFLVIAIFAWLVIHFSIGNLIGFLFIFSVCILFIRAVISEAGKENKLEDANRQLEKDKKELVKLDQMKDEFMMMATHELTTPVTAIRGKLSMAVDENMIHLDAEQKKFFEPVLNAVNRLNHTSRELVDATLINQDKFLINPEVGDLNAFIEDIVVKHKDEATAIGSKLSFVAKHEAKNISFDKKMISEVVSNFIDNALHFTKNGEINVITKLDDDHKYILISVSDTGSGIDKEALVNLFNKFTQTSRFDPLNPSEQQGAGLGLYIAKKIIQLHGGKIWCESEKDKGSTFTFSLPIK
ncbi:MAG: ATP-binding protein [Candidatus Berkelbacteria bacterium]